MAVLATSSHYTMAVSKEDNSLVLTVVIIVGNICILYRKFIEFPQIARKIHFGIVVPSLKIDLKVG